jgi:FAS-associated factor 2
MIICIYKTFLLQDLTGIEDINECRQTLQRHSWDLEIAVQDTLNAREGRPSVFNQDPPPNRINNDNNASEIVPRRESYIPIRAANQSLLSYVMSIVYNVVTQTVWSFFSFFARFIRPDNRRKYFLFSTCYDV